MGRELQEVFFSGGTLNVTADGNIAPVYSTANGVFKGAIVQVTVTTASAGSVFLYESGTNAVIYNNNAPSGTQPTVSWPRRVVSNGTISPTGINPGSGNVWTPFYTTRPIAFGGSAFTSGDTVRVSVLVD